MSTPSHIFAACPCRVERGSGLHGDCIRVTRLIPEGEVVFHIEGVIVQRPTRYTIQLDADCHIAPGRRLWGLVNHSCHPNIRVDVEQRRMIAMADIPAGAELRFNYNTTEWSMASPFDCNCQISGCAGRIRGFRFLSASQRAAIQPWVSPLLENWFGRFDMYSIEPPPGI